MHAVVLMLLVQAPDRVVEDIDSLLPSLHSLRAFPWTHRDAVEQEQRHSQHMDWLTRLEESRTIHRDIVQLWRKESEFRLACWANLLGATDPGRSEGARRQALEGLRDLLGEARFNRGVMPRPLPRLDYPPLHIPRVMPPADGAQ
jgi:hypothetical protein